MRKGLNKLIEDIRYWWWGSTELWQDLASIFIPAAFIIAVAICSNSCGALKEVPVETVEKIVYRDSLIYVLDSIEVPVPYEVVKEVLPDIDTSHLKTTLAESIAYLDTSKRKLHHTLEQKGTIQYVYDTVHTVQYVDRIMEKEVPVEIEVIKYKRDVLFWALIGWFIMSILAAVLKIYLK